MDEQNKKKEVYNIDMNFLDEIEKEDVDYKTVYNIVNKDFIEKENLEKLELEKKEGRADEEFEMQALDDLIKQN